MTEDVTSAWPAEAVSALVDRYERPLLAYACRMLGGDWQGAQDAVQETFLRLCRENREKIESRVAAWLFSVCRSRVIDMQRTNHATPIDASQVTVNGLVRLKLYKGNVIVVGRKSDSDSLFDERIATFEDDEGAYNQADAEGFIKLNALRLRIAGRKKGQAGT